MEHDPLADADSNPVHAPGTLPANTDDPALVREDAGDPAAVSSTADPDDATEIVRWVIWWLDPFWLAERLSAALVNGLARLLDR